MHDRIKYSQFATVMESDINILTKSYLRKGLCQQELDLNNELVNECAVNVIQRGRRQVDKSKTSAKQPNQTNKKPKKKILYLNVIYVSTLKNHEENDCYIFEKILQRAPINIYKLALSRKNY